MKTMNTKTTIKLALAVAVMLFANNAWAKIDGKKCYVSNSAWSGDDSLSKALEYLNKGAGFCSELIQFDKGLKGKTIEINDSIVLGSNVKNDFVFNGNGVFLKTTTGKPVFSIDKVENATSVTIKDFTIDAGSADSAFASCSNSNKTLNISGIIINNQPTVSATFDHCDDVTLSNIALSGQDDNAATFITVTGGSNFNFDAASQLYKNLTGGLISISDASDFSIALNAQYDSDVTATDPAISIVNSNGSVNSAHIQGAPATALYLEGLNGNVNFADLVFTASANNASNGVELIDSSNLKFTDLVVSDFGDSGVLIQGNSDKNILSGSGIKIFSNKKNGVKIASIASDNPSENQITGATITENNSGCGIYLESGAYNQVSGNNLYLDDDCGVYPGGSVTAAGDDDLIFLMQSQNSTWADLLTETVGGQQITKVELHKVWPAGLELNTASKSKGGFNGAIFNKIATPQNTPIFVNRVKTPVDGTDLGLGNAARSIENAQAYSAPNKSLIGDNNGMYTIDNDCASGAACLPDIVNNVDAGTRLMALMYDSNNHVIGVWKGQPIDSVATSGGVLNDAGCIQDPQDPSVSRRVYDINSDQDGDGIPDIKEDSNLNCIQDAGETLPTNPDTDDDGLTDGLETCTKKVEATCETTDPLNKYSDGDLLTDGEEDANHNGVHGLADNETDPNVTDTDKDGFSDSDEVTKYGTSPLNPDTDGDGYPDGDKVNEKCPMIPGNENCYYANCIPVDSAVVDAAVSEGEDAGNAIDCDNTDGDGICSQVEDKNGNCQYDPGETDATKADTDGDGISDGTEDLNLNGKVDSTESSPIKADTDGDCIPDNLEDKDGDGHFNLEGGETSAYLTDSDGDGLPDGRGTSITDSEDYNCNGTVDDGETKPYLADTDGDGKEDATDVCPWETNGSCVVRYCGVNGYADYDTDGDGLPDSVEDLNGDCMWTRESKEPDPRVGDTDADGLTDGQEVQCYSTNPVSADTDGDGKSDSEEVSASVAGGQCTLMYNLGDNNPVKPQYSCALNTQEATLDATVTIISMVGFLALGLVLRKKASV